MAPRKSIEGTFYQSPWWFPELLTTGSVVLVAAWFLTTEIFQSELNWPNVFLICQSYGVVWALLCVTLLHWDTFFHELGHAAAATTVGYPVHHIQIGVYPSRKPVIFSFLGYKWMVYSFIRGGGMVNYGVSSARNARLKMAWIIAAGPLVNFVIIGLLVFAYLRFADIGNSAASIVQPTLPFLILNGLVIMQVARTWRGLVPGDVRMGDRVTPNDGKLLLEMRKTTDQLILAWVELEKIHAAFKEKNIPTPSDPGEAIRVAEQDWRDVIVLYHLSTIVRQTQDAQYLKVLRKALDADCPDRKLRITILDEYLTGLLEKGLVSTEPKVDAFSQELLDIHDDKVTAQGTRGGILIDLGQTREGKVMLREVLDKTDSPVDKAYCNTFLALSEKQNGNLDLAKGHAEAALLHNASCPALSRVSDLLPPQP